MMPLPAAGEAALIWEQIDQRGKHFALQADTAVVATLDLPRAWNTTATAQAAESVWTFQRAGFLRPHLTISAAGDADAGATFAAAGHGKSQVTLRDGRVFLWQPARGKGQRWAFVDDDGQSSVVFAHPGKGFGAYHLALEIVPTLRDEPTGLLLATLGMYLIVEAVTAAMIAATIIIAGV